MIAATSQSHDDGVFGVYELLRAPIPSVLGIIVGTYTLGILCELANIYYTHV